MKNVKRKNSVERFIYSQNYKLASQSENPNVKTVLLYLLLKEKLDVMLMNS